MIELLWLRLVESLGAGQWYLRFSLSYRDVQELLAERGVAVDHSTIWHWVQRFAPELLFRLRPHLKPTNRSWRVDETYVRVKGRWCYLYRAIDSRGATMEFFLSAFRDLEAAKSLFRWAPGSGAPRSQAHHDNPDLRQASAKCAGLGKSQGTALASHHLASIFEEWHNTDINHS